MILSLERIPFGTYVGVPPRVGLCDHPYCSAARRSSTPLLLIRHLPVLLVHLETQPAATVPHSGRKSYLALQRMELKILPNVPFPNIFSMQGWNCDIDMQQHRFHADGHWLKMG